MHVPTQYSAIQAGHLLADTLNKQNFYFGWHGKSLMDIQASLDTILNTATATGATASSLNTQKSYMYDHVATHTMRVNTTYAEASLKFFKLTPRSAIPSFIGGGSAFPRISPPATYNYNDCLTENPALFTVSIGDEAAGVTGQPEMTYSDPNMTLFDDPTLCSLFKIRPMKVNGPSGRNFSHKLLPGQEVNWVVKHSKPTLINCAKFGLLSTPVSSLGNTWEVLPQTPLFCCIIVGTPSRDTAAPTTRVGLGLASADYIVRRHWRTLLPEKNAGYGVTTYAPFGGPGAVTGNLEETNLATGGVGNEAVNT